MNTIFGIAGAVEIAPVEVDNAMPADLSFTELCETYRDSVEILDDDPEEAEEYSDQEDDPIASFIEQGKTKGSFNTFDFSTTTLKKLFPGGTVSGDDFIFPKSNTGFETALRFSTDSGHTIAFPKVKLFAKRNMQLVKKGVALINVSFTALSPAQISKNE